MEYQSFVSNKRIILTSFCILFLLVSCKLSVPIKEMSIAKSTITRAVEVKAEKYAPEELDKAKEELLKSHDYVRDEDVESAKKAAEESMNNSNQAVLKSLPLLANDTLSEAKEIYEEANIADAERYAPEEFALAGEKIGEAEESIETGEYWESYLKSGEAIKHATDARDKALLNISALKEKMENISNEARDLESLGARDIAPEEMSAVDVNLEDASSLLESSNLKEALTKITDADSALKEAGVKVWKQIASEKIQLAEDMLAEIEASQYKEYFLQDLEKAAALVNEGKDLFAGELYQDSNSKSEEAIDLMNSIVIAMEKKAEEKRLEEEARAAEESKAVVSVEYIVQYNPEKRDCLWRIAMYTYKDARLWPLIYMANIDQIKDPDLIFPGQKLIIPPIPKRTVPDEMKSEDMDSEEVTEQTGQEEEIIDEGEEPESDIFNEESNDDNSPEEEIPVEINSYGSLNIPFQPYS